MPIMVYSTFFNWYYPQMWYYVKEIKIQNILYLLIVKLSLLINRSNNGLNI